MRDILQFLQEIEYIKIFLNELLKDIDYARKLINYSIACN